MSRETEIILIVFGIIGLYLAYQTLQTAKQGLQNTQQGLQSATHPIATFGSEIENWFSGLWGTHSGGTPNSISTSS